MSRTKTLPDDVVLERALSLIHGGGPERLTFASLANATGLSGATLVQRFRNKTELQQRTLLHAWDLLDKRSADLVSTMEKNPDGARRLLVDLSKNYGDTKAYAQGLLLLREDMLDPVLRTRGAHWKTFLTRALDTCFTNELGAPANVGSLIATYWQGALLWWAFDPIETVDAHIDTAMREFISALSERA